MALGFDGRQYLTEAEYETYMRRMPVRYLKQKLADTCYVCGKPASTDKPFERSHLIPFGVGIKLFKLTPDYLDSDHNIVTAHRGSCNKAAELTILQIAEKLKESPR